MTADREVLRQAVLTALEPWCTETTYLRATETYDISWVIDGERAANAIVDAVLAAEHIRYEWAYRYPNGHVATLPAVLLTEEVVREAVAEHPDLLTAVRRRVGEWEDA